MPSFPVTQKKIAQETNDHEQGNQHEVAKAPGADEHGGRTIRHETGYRRNTVIRAQFANFFSRSLGIQEGMSQNGLRYPEGGNDQDEDYVYEEKTTQLFFGIEQGISHKEQGNIVEKELQAQQTEYQTRRRRIKDLQHSKPDKKKKRDEKRGPEKSNFFPPSGNKKGKINDSDENVLGEINRHVVPEVFPRKIFEQEPRQEEIEAVAPAIEHAHDEGGTDK